MTITEIVARLGHECRLPWARCQAAVVNLGLAQGDECGLARGHGGLHRGRLGNAPPWDEDEPLPPTLAEWAAEHEREHPGEPGPVASWTSEDGRVSWLVIDHMVQVDVGDLRCRRFVIGGIVLSGDGTGRATAADLTELARLVAVADGETR